MAEKPKVSTFYRFSVVPFTGAVFAVWAFFSPESYGTWLGQIVKAFRVAAGF